MPTTSRKRGVPALIILACAALPDALPAWSDTGHKIVCEIAWQRFTPETKAWVKDLLSADPYPAGSFPEACVWADAARQETHRATYQYHFVNIARGTEGLDIERDCPAYDCVAVAIRRYTVYLERDGMDPEDRAEALKFLGHFVGDAHQPLHAGYAEDRGGNEILVEWFGQTNGGELNLHQVWDAEVSVRAGHAYPRSALEWTAQVTVPQAASWSGLDVEGWVDEAYRHAVETAYRLPVGNKLGQEYFERALPVVEEQLKKAGVRLAALVNSIAAGAARAQGAKR